MYRDRILEQKKILGISMKTMAERSKLRLPEETISRFLSNKTHDSRVSTVLDIGETVGLEPYELFMDAITAAEFKLFLETKLLDIDNTAELERLRAINAAQETEIRLLEERLRNKEELLAVYAYFTKNRSTE